MEYAQGVVHLIQELQQRLSAKSKRLIDQVYIDGASPMKSPKTDDLSIREWLSQQLGLKVIYEPKVNGKSYRSALNSTVVDLLKLADRVMGYYKILDVIQNQTKKPSDARIQGTKPPMENLIAPNSTTNDMSSMLLSPYHPVSSTFLER